MKKIIVAITGASGVMLGERLVRHLLGAEVEVHAVLSRGGADVLREEMGLDLGSSSAEVQRRFRAHYGNSSRLRVADAGDLADSLSSGSFKVEGMVIAPCSMSTAATIASGMTLNLIHRAAGVSIKERRTLVLIPRESPLSPIHLKNLLYLSEVGAHIVPATTAFYHRPKSVEEMVDFTLGRVLDILKIEHRLFKRWKGSSAAE